MPNFYNSSKIERVTRSLSKKRILKEFCRQYLNYALLVIGIVLFDLASMYIIAYLYNIQLNLMHTLKLCIIVALSITSVIYLAKIIMSIRKLK